MTEVFGENRVVSIVVEDIAKVADGWKITAHVPAFDSQYPTTFTRVPAEIAEQMTPLGAYSMEILRENLKRDKDGSRDWHYYWGLVKFAAPDPLQIDADGAYHLEPGPDPEAPSKPVAPPAHARPSPTPYTDREAIVQRGLDRRTALMQARKIAQHLHRASVVGEEAELTATLDFWFGHFLGLLNGTAVENPQPD
jgi:hypothetical protein